MAGKLFKRLGYVIAGGAIVFSFLLLAQVNMDDLRHKLGSLLQPNDPSLRAGGLYIVNASGHVRPGRPPVCNPSNDLVKAHFDTVKGSVSVRNSLGYSVPAIAKLSTLLFAPHQGLGAGPNATSDIEIEGHTLALDWVETTQLRSEANMWLYIHALYRESEACERVIESYWQRGSCIALVHRVSRAGETMIGYTYNDHCMLPQVEDGNYDRGPTIAAKPHLRMTARLSQVKDFVGLISHEPAQFQPVLAEGG